VSDFTVSARLDGDSQGLVEALSRGDKAAEDFQKRQEERARRGNQYTVTAAAAEKQRADALAQSTKAADVAAVANDNAADATARHAVQAKALGEQTVKLAETFARGGASGAALIQTGAGIARTALAIGGAFATAAVATGAFFLAGVSHADTLSARTRTLQVELAALGQADRLPTGRLTAAIDRAAAPAGFNRVEANEGAQQFLAAGIFNPDTIDRGLRASRDLALALGSDLRGAAALAASGLDGTAEGVAKLDGKLRLLTDSERVQIRTLQEMGRANEATEIVLGALERRVSGLGDQALGTGQRISDGIGKAWERALDAFSQTAPVQAAHRALVALGDTVADALAPDLRDAADRLATVRAELVQLQAMRGAGGAGRDVRIRSLSDQQSQLEIEVAQRTTATAYGSTLGRNVYGDRSEMPADGRDAEAATRRVRELVESMDELPRKREQIQNALQRVNDEFAQGAIGAELYARAVGLLDSALSRLRSPLEKSGETLADLQALVATPVAQRPAREAELRAQREAAALPPEERDEFIYNAREAQRLNARLQADRSGARKVSDAATQLKEFDRSTISYREQTEALERLVAVEGKGAAATREAERVNQVATATARLRAAVETDGSTAIAAAAQKQIEAYDALSRRQAAAQVRREAQAFNQQFDPDAAFAQNMSKLEELQATGLLSARTVSEASKDYDLRRLEASRDATDGAIAAFRRYADEASNAGQQAADGIRTGMRAAEDAVANFAVTGSFNFNSFANSVLADLARVATRKAITGPLASAAGDALGSFGSWLGDWWTGGTSVPGISGGPVAVGGIPTVPAFHNGGIVGRDGTNPRTVPAAYFAKAPRFHDGGLVLGADEMPIIAKRGERVLTEEQQRAWNGSGGSVRVEVTVINNANANVRTEEGVGADGMPSLKIFVDQVEKDLAGKFMNTRGPLFKAVTGTLGAKPVARP